MLLKFYRSSCFKQLQTRQGTRKQSPAWYTRQPSVTVVYAGQVRAENAQMIFPNADLQGRHSLRMHSQDSEPRDHRLISVRNYFPQYSWF